MNLIELKKVKRCGTCGRLYPRNYTKCPYCQGTFLVNRDYTQQEDNYEAPKLQPLSEKAKKRLMYAGIAAAVVIALVFVANIIMGYFKLDRPITDPLTAEEIADINKDHPGFFEMYSEIENMRETLTTEADKAEFGDITYKQMMSFLEMYSDTTYCNKIVAEANGAFDSKYHVPLVPKIEAEKKKWIDFLSTHNPNNYLKITSGQRYETDDWGTKRPGFYFKLAFPKGNIADCSVKYGLWNKSGEYWNDYANTTGDLEELKLITQDEHYRWTNVDCYYEDTYISWEMKTEVLSVTLPNGTVIAAEDTLNVPTEAKAYITDANPETELVFIRTLVDKNYPDQNVFVSDAVIKKLGEKDALCLKLCERTNKNVEIVKRGWKFANVAESAPEESVEEVDENYY